MCNTMGKWTKYVKYYNSDWEDEEELKDWIRRVPGDDTRANCRFCQSDIRAHHSDLIAHSKTAKHHRKSAPFTNLLVAAVDDTFAISVDLLFIMPKVQKIEKAWKNEYKLWLTDSPNPTENSWLWCKLCNCNVKAKKYNADLHVHTKKHQRAFKRFASPANHSKFTKTNNLECNAEKPVFLEVNFDEEQSIEMMQDPNYNSTSHLQLQPDLTYCRSSAKKNVQERICAMIQRNCETMTRLQSPVNEDICGQFGKLIGMKLRSFPEGKADKAMTHILQYLCNMQ